jgi:polar amino acid transport system permease protein
MQMIYDWDFSIILGYWPALLKGLFYTFAITIFSCFFGSLLAFILLLVHLSHNKTAKIFERLFTIIFLAIPIPVLLVWIFYCLPMFGFQIDALPAAIIALSLSLAAFLIEMIRGTLNTIPKSQFDVAKLSKIPQWLFNFRVIIPQVILISRPAIFANYITTLKLSSLASLISAPEILNSASLIITVTYRPLEVYTLIAALFLLIVIPLVMASAKFERDHHG